MARLNGYSTQLRNIIIIIIYYYYFFKKKKVIGAATQLKLGKIGIGPTGLVGPIPATDLRVF